MPTRKLLDDTILPLRRLIRTDQPERMRAFFSDVCKGAKLELRGDSSNFNGQANRVQLEQIGFDYSAFDAAVNVEFPELKWIRQPICLFGGGEVTIGRAAAPLSLNETGVVGPGAATKSRYSSGYRHLVLRVDPDSVRAKLEALIGDVAVRTLEWGRSGDFRTPQLQILRKLAIFYAQEIDSFGSHLSAFARKEFEQTILVAFLQGNKHNYSYLLEKPVESATPKQIWLVEAFIEANWNKSITIDEIARMTGVSARSIFHTFKQKRGYSPMGFAKKIRLERAHEMLQRAEVSVAEVAFHCGFQSHGHFSREYRVRFKELPSQTLARSR